MHMPLKCDTSHPQLKRSASGESNGSYGSQRSATSTASSNKTLLFGEIPSPASPVSEDLKSYPSTSSICNLVMSRSPSFQRFWQTENARNTFLSHLPQSDLSNLRLVCLDMRVKAAPYLFRNLTVSFNARSFTKPARIRALDNVGPHVREFTFRMPHTDATFLPPLINSVTGEEEQFAYEPQIAHDPTRPRYGSYERTQLLIQQYPPLFHAATNVPSFIRALSTMPNLTSLHISCPSHSSTPPGRIYRRDIVDFALISLRIAIERASLPSLASLSLEPLHPAALLYLHPGRGLGFGASPAAPKRWAQIKKLDLEMDGGAEHADHLRMLHSYLRAFSPHTEQLSFKWLTSHRGPSPLSLSDDLYHESHPTSTSPRRPSTPLKPLTFPHLTHLRLEHAVMHASQISKFITAHARRLAEFNFEDVRLRSGNWDEALAPLTRITGSERWKERAEEVMDVPVMMAMAPPPAPPKRPIAAPEPRVMGLLGEEAVVSRARGQGLGRLLSSKGRRSRGEACAGAEPGRKFWLANVFSSWR